MHGHTSDRRTWDAVLATALPQTHRVIAVDLRGHGDSLDANVGSLTFTIEDNVRDLHCTLQALGVSRCILVGHSMGVRPTLAYANRYPGQVVDEEEKIMIERRRKKNRAQIKKKREMDRF